MSEFILANVIERENYLLMRKKLSSIAFGYVKAAFFTEEENLSEGMEQRERREFKVHPSQFAKLNELCRKFAEENQTESTEATESQVGNDLWYTRNGHGVGFWDRPEIYGEEKGEALSEAAHALGECDLYLGGDGFCWFSGMKS